MKNNIILNALPPATTKWPSTALSILKSFLEVHGHHVSIKYWNIVLESIQKRFLESREDIDMDNNGLFVFINYLLVNSGGNINRSNLKYELSSSFPMWNYMDECYIEHKMKAYAIELEKIINREVMQMHLDECCLFGITTKLNQWICGGIIAQKVKQLFPELKIVIGGMGTREEAMALMNNFEYYDYAIWGEGEYPLLMLSEAIISKSSEIEIPYLIYRDKKKKPQISTRIKQKKLFDMNSGIIPDYSDFFQYPKNSNQGLLPIEGSRGCHWKQCHFCFLNDGYKYRAKSTVLKIQEIKFLIEKYNIRKFIFPDNDLIGRDIIEFESFLDELVKIREQYDDFEIVLAEIITKGINSSIIKKMALAGFKNVQIGYESASNNLLKKINKKNTFASNLLFIKWARAFSILTGANIITGLLEETVEDILEAIDNLHFLRFLLKQDTFEHKFIPLHISSASPYFTVIEKKQEINNWDETGMMHLLPLNFIKPIDQSAVFFYCQKQQKDQWVYFKNLEQFYKKANFYYQFVEQTGIIHYREYCDGLLINELVFEELLHFEILNFCNHCVSSLKDLILKLPDETRKEIDIISAIEFLKNEKLLYVNDDLSEIVSIVNSDVIL